MKKILFFVTFFVASNAIMSQTTATKVVNASDPLDISKEMEQINKYGVPTINTIAVMKAKADTLYEAKSWKEAAVAYEAYAKNVNWLANILAQCVEPYYSASYDDKKNISYSTLKPFTPFEEKANECKQDRNRAYVKMGLCYKNLGDIKNAIAYLHKGLDLLAIDDIGYWTMAKDAVAEILQFTPVK